MTLARLQAHDRRLAQLRRQPVARMSAGEIAELHRIEAARDCLWRQLPRRIANLRHTLAQLEAYAAEIGVGP
ncbi:hypothetical protein [Sphingomonas sp. GV3]|uniref:hypothetical protein n=1 Tax=Sphingomonas sp. GV3 TaxID=3040671 RepID=UPI00280A5920|nr:hypothetical protein [Sphingomonas sp. GV3]